jgi:nucleoside-diphosphate-sugar epimerase
MTTHLILGSSGFVGEELLLHLLNQGVKVIGVDLHSPAIKHPHFLFIQCDIRKLSHMATFQDVSVIHHCASLVPLAHNKSDMYSVNVDGTARILEVFANQNWDNFLYYSTSAVTGFHDETISEEAHSHPVEDYGASKLMAENLVKKFCTKNNRHFAILRPRTIVGAGRMGLFELLFSWISRNKNVYLPGPGPELFQMIHIRDLISAVMLIVEKKATGIINIGNHPEQGLKKDLEDLIKKTHSSSRLLIFPQEIIWVFKLMTQLKINPFAPWQYLAFNETHLLDTKKLEALGWSAKYSNSEMLREGFDSYLASHKIHASLHRRPMNLLKFGFMR